LGLKRRISYSVSIREEVFEIDLLELPVFLRRLLDRLKPLFRADPYRLQDRLETHTLRGKLSGFRAVEINLDDDLSYRLVYQIEGKTVRVYSLAEHDSAYERAKDRKIPKRKRRS